MNKKLNLTSNIKYVDSSFNIIFVYFRANYALGRPVKGTATVAVYPRYKER